MRAMNINIPPHAPFWTRELHDKVKAVFDDVKDAGWERGKTSDEECVPHASRLQAATGRACGDCTLCCKLIGVPEIDKLQGHWCEHCDPKAGCRIYEERPTSCRVFVCGWAGGEGPPEMKPNKSHCIFDYDSDMDCIRVHVDPHHADAWRTGPVADHIRLLHAMGRMVIVLIQNKQRPCPAFGIPGVGDGPAMVVDPATGQPWCKVTAENLP
jgi:uncharacterized protein